MDQFAASARMNQYEKGKHTPDYSTLKRIAAVLGVPVAYFYADKDDLAELIKSYGNLNKNDKLQLFASITKSISNNYLKK